LTLQDCYIILIVDFWGWKKSLLEMFD